MFAVLAHTKFGLLQLVNLLLDALEATIVRSAEILASGGLGDASQGAFIKLRIHGHVLPSHRRVHRHAGLTVTADTHGIYADTKGLGDLCSRLRVDVTTVVRSIGQQNDHFLLRLAVFHAVHRVRKT